MPASLGRASTTAIASLIDVASCVTYRVARSRLFQTLVARNAIRRPPITARGVNMTGVVALRSVAIGREESMRAPRMTSATTTYDSPKVISAMISIRCASTHPTNFGLPLPQPHIFQHACTDSNVLAVQEGGPTQSG